MEIEEFKKVPAGSFLTDENFGYWIKPVQSEYLENSVISLKTGELEHFSHFKVLYVFTENKYPPFRRKNNEPRDND